LTVAGLIGYFCCNRSKEKESAVNYTVGTYLAYLAISIAITIWVARTLHKNGRQFLVDSFHGNTALADSVNHLLIVGFYLVNVGYVALALKYAAKADNLQEALEAVATKVGSVMLILGAMHFLNLAVFAKWRRRAMLHHAPPPIPPTANLRGATTQTSA
jgi:hypothetical protein